MTLSVKTCESSEQHERIQIKPFPYRFMRSLVLLQVTVMHSMQAGYLEKAQKYTDKALMQLEKLKSRFCSGKPAHSKDLFSVNVWISSVVLDCSPILSTFQVILLEHIIMCRLVTGHKATALQEVDALLCPLFTTGLLKTSLKLQLWEFQVATWSWMCRPPQVLEETLLCSLFRFHRSVSCANSPPGYSPTTLLSCTRY